MPELSEEESDSKQASRQSFFARLAATAQLTRKEAHRRKLESIDLRQAEYQIGKKAFEARLVPPDLNNFVTKLEELNAQLVELETRQTGKPASTLGEKAQGAASTATRAAKAKALELKRSSLFKDLGTRLRKGPSPDPALSAEIAAANAVEEQIRLLDAEMAALQHDSWTKHPLLIVVAALLLALLVLGVAFARNVRRTHEQAEANRRMAVFQEQTMAMAQKQQEQMRQLYQQQRQAQYVAAQQTMASAEQQQRDYLEKRKREQEEQGRAQHEQAEAAAKQQAQLAQKQAEDRKAVEAEANRKVGDPGDDEGCEVQHHHVPGVLRPG